MFDVIAKAIISQLIRSHLPADQKVKVSFTPPEGEITVRHIKKKNNHIYKVTFKELADVINEGGKKK